MFFYNQFLMATFSIYNLHVDFSADTFWDSIPTMIIMLPLAMAKTLLHIHADLKKWMMIDDFVSTKHWICGSFAGVSMFDLYGSKPKQTPFIVIQIQTWFLP